MIGHTDAMFRITRAVIIGGLLATVAACGSGGATPTSASVPTATATTTPVLATSTTAVESASPAAASPAAASPAAASPAAGGPGTVVAWGLNTYGQATVPAALTGVTRIAAGYQHSLALKSDGTVVAWGINNSGQTTVPAGLSGVTAIAAGYYHSLALNGGRRDDTLRVATGGYQQVRWCPTRGAGVIRLDVSRWHA